MTILVTGGAGFIGSHLTQKLLKNGHKVAVIDVLDPYYSLSLKKYNLSHNQTAADGSGSEYRFFQVDVRDQEACEDVFARVKPEVVIHLAAKAGVRNSLLHPQEYFDVNVMGTLHILSLATKHEIKKCLIASSSSVYGTNEKIPFSETDPVESQISPYAASKRAVEVMAKTYAHSYDMPIQLFRFFTVYGPSGRPDMAPVIFAKAISEQAPLRVFGSTTTQRDYTYIDDIVGGLVKALEINEQFAIYNLGNDDPIELGTFISTLEKHLGKKATIELTPKQAGDVERTWADISLAREKLGYSPQTNLERGLQQFAAWYQEHAELYT